MLKSIGIIQTALHHVLAKSCRPTFSQTVSVSTELLCMHSLALFFRVLFTLIFTTQTILETN